ncbi:hypothetical protein [Mycolicibacterium mucogenicum]|uniref:hypothetical protein n=1 Tax=Mycolicibacterium mucogenicum TaxID=56689 RepID=UPI00076A31E5|nr:hypothetical protein [Mycolicibacterium mucogenicum]
MTTDSQFTVKFTDGTERSFPGAQTTDTYSIEASGVLVIVSRTDTTIQTDRYSPAAWTCVSESTSHTGAVPSTTPGFGVNPPRTTKIR